VKSIAQCPRDRRSERPNKKLEDSNSEKESLSGLRGGGAEEEGEQ
jgi:hypothetical protein